jgi:hypothetical protein
MTKTSILGFAIVVCMSLSAGNSPSIASEQQATDKAVSSKAGTDRKPVLQAKKAAHRDPMQASASYTGGSRAVAPQTNAVSHRYDGGCRARYRAGSTEYSACLQEIPAAALVGGGFR